MQVRVDNMKTKIITIGIVSILLLAGFVIPNVAKTTGPVADYRLF